MPRFDTDLPALDVMALAAVCVRYPGSGYLDLLARAATAGADDASGLRARARTAAEEHPVPTGQAPSAPPVLRGLRPRLVAGFALARAGLLPHGGTVKEVAQLLELAHRASGPRELPAVYRDLWLDALHLTADAERFPYPRDEDVESRHWRVHVDAMNPFLAAAPVEEDDPSTQQAWLAELSRLFTPYGLSAVELREGPGLALHRVTAPASALRGAGEPTGADAGLVSVVMPAFDPVEGPPFALASVLRQTWAHLEVLLCDDGSGARGRETLAGWAGLDPRVRLVRREENGGAYAARNAGLSAARGEFVTFQDIDDWSHPERVARQVQALRSDPAAMATLSRMARVDDHLGLTVLGYSAIGVNASSALFRRVPVLSRIGGFDSVRRAGDNEFLGRLAAVFGSESLVYQPEILALVRRTKDSLSRNDHRLLYRDPARAAYRACYRRWHEHIGSGHADPVVHPPRRAPVPARSYLTGGVEPVPHAEVAVLAGVARNAPTTVDLAAEVTALVGTGRTVAVVDCPAPFDLSVPSRPPAPEFLDLVNDATVTWRTADDPFRADVAVVRDPAAVTHLGDALAAASITEAVLIADYAPARHYDPVQVERVMVQGHRCSIRWLPATRTIAAELAASVEPARVLPPRIWGVAAPPGDHPPRSAGPLRVGVTTPSTRLSARELVAWAAEALPRDTEVEVWCRTRLGAVVNQLGRPVVTPGPPRWPAVDVFGEVSHVTVPPTPGRGAHLHPEAVAAVQQGCVLVLDPAYRQHFGEAALYTDERSCQEWLDLHAADPGAVAEQQGRAERFLRRVLSAHTLRDSFAEIVRRPG